MPRPARDFAVGGIFHVYSRGSNRQAIFRLDTDRADFLSCLGRVLERHGLALLAFCLMTNHFHLVVDTPDERLSHAMKALNGRYALRYNRRYACDAHLFKNRFGAIRQRSLEHLQWTLRYVVRNPVEKGLCASPSEWPWSSYRASIGATPSPAFLAREQLLSYFGDTPERAVAAYRAAVLHEAPRVRV